MTHSQPEKAEGDKVNTMTKINYNFIFQHRWVQDIQEKDLQIKIINTQSLIHSESFTRMSKTSNKSKAKKKAQEKSK